MNKRVFKNRESLSRWVYELHETVNGLLGKSSNLTYNEVRDRFENFRSRCINNKAVRTEKGNLLFYDYENKTTFESYSYTRCIGNYCMKLRGMSSLPSITSCPKLENGDTMIIIGGSKYIWNSFNPNRALYYAFDNYKKYSVEQISENISLMARIAYISVRDNIEENMAKKYLINNTTITNSVFVTKITL